MSIFGPVSNVFISFGDISPRIIQTSFEKPFDLSPFPEAGYIAVQSDAIQIKIRVIISIKGITVTIQRLYQPDRLLDFLYRVTCYVQVLWRPFDRIWTIAGVLRTVN